MGQEAILKTRKLELRRGPKAAEAVIFVNFSGSERGKRNNIVAISGSVLEPQTPGITIEFPLKEGISIEQVKRQETYSPRRSRERIDENGMRIIRMRRPSRCLIDRPHYPRRCKGKAHIRSDDPQEGASTNQQDRLVAKGNNEQGGGSLSRRRFQQNSRISRKE